MRGLLAPLLAVFITGCVSVGMDPLLAGMTETPAPAACAPQEDTDEILPPNPDAGLCAALREASNSAGLIRGAALELDRTQAGLGATQMSAAVATLGFTAFRAHPDNALASGLIGGSALVARDGLRPQARRDVLRTGLRALNCTVERGSVFIGAAARAVTLEDDANKTASAALLIRSLAPAGDGADATRLREALTRLDAAIATARASLAPMRSADAQVNDTRRLIEQNMERKLATLQPDYSAIAAAIAKLAPQTTQGSSGGRELVAGTDARARLLSIAGQLGITTSLRTTGRGRATATNVEDLIALANELALRLGSSAGPGQREYAAIAECAAFV